MELSFAAEEIFKIGFFRVTNSFITSILVTSILVLIAWKVSKNIKLLPSGFQNFAEYIVESFYNFNVQLAGKKAAFIFPFFMTFFLFIITANWIGLLPGVGTIGFYPKEESSHAGSIVGEAHATNIKETPIEKIKESTGASAQTEAAGGVEEELQSSEGGHIVSLLRPINSDLNTTLALALISLIATHYFSIKTIGIKEYLMRYFSFNPINLFVGVLELVGEFTKIASLSFRLFGNVFAGEALLHTIATLSKTKLTAFLIPLPFMILEIVVGFVQALVFSMLTLVFMVILGSSHNESH